MFHKIDWTGWVAGSAAAAGAVVACLGLVGVLLYPLTQVL